MMIARNIRSPDTTLDRSTVDLGRNHHTRTQPRERACNVASLGMQPVRIFVPRC